MQPSKPSTPSAPRTAPSPSPRIEGTVIILLSLLVAWLFEPTESPYAVANHYARFVGVSLILAVLFEFKVMGFARLVRADWVCLSIFYGLSYLEFLFAQPALNALSTLPQTRAACGLFNLGILSITLARHIWPTRNIPVPAGQPKVISYKILLIAFWAAFAIGYLHIFVAVDFNLLRAIDEMLGPRFSQSWGRGRLGDWKALLVELGLLIYLIPPIYGTLFALRKQIPKSVLICATPIFLFTLFYGFSSGTRNIFGTYVVTFIVAYMINLQTIRWVRLGVFATVVLGLTAYGTYHMLEFRNMGLKRYFEGGRFQSDAGRDTLFVDFNLKYLGVVAEAFPENYAYLGMEVPFWALVRPIPRAIWSGKPEGLSVSIEEATNVEQMSVATTWVGESYMAFGRWGVFGMGCLLGLLCGYWNQRGSQYAPPIQKIIYASGFFAAALSMRSIFWFTTAILPTLAMLVGARFYLKLFGTQRALKRSSQSTALPPSPRDP